MRPFVKVISWYETTTVHRIYFSDKFAILQTLTDYWNHVFFNQNRFTNYALRQNRWFHLNFPFICRNNPAAPAYGVYITLSCFDIPELVVLIMCFCWQGSYWDQGFLLVKLKSSLRKFRHHNLFYRYGISVSHVLIGSPLFHRKRKANLSTNILSLEGTNLILYKRIW